MQNRPIQIPPPPQIQIQNLQNINKQLLSNLNYYKLYYNESVKTNDYLKTEINRCYHQMQILIEDNKRMKSEIDFIKNGGDTNIFNDNKLNRKKRETGGGRRGRKKKNDKKTITISSGNIKEYFN